MHNRTLLLYERGEYMNEYKIKVNLERGLIINPDIHLVQNDYNSTTFNFEFDDNSYEQYTKVFQLQYPDGTIWKKEIRDNKVTLANFDEEGNPVSILVQTGKYYFDIAIYDNDSKLTTTEKVYFNVREEITGENVEIDDRLPVLDDLINTVNKNIIETETQSAFAKEQGDYAKEQGDRVYEVVDYVVTTSERANEKADTAISIAKGANQALSYLTYFDMITNFNAFDKNKFERSQSIMIKQLNVPDMWIYELSDEYVEYNYTTDEEVINLLMSDNGFHVGYYILGPLETQKVDLTDYVKDTDYATSSKAGIVRANTASYGTEIDASNGMIKGVVRTYDQYQNGLYGTGFISKGTLENVLNNRVATETRAGTIKVWVSENEDGEKGLNISTEV